MGTSVNTKIKVNVVQLYITILSLNGLLHFQLLSFIGLAIWPHFFFTVSDTICFAVAVS